MARSWTGARTLGRYGEAWQLLALALCVIGCGRKQQPSTRVFENVHVSPVTRVALTLAAGARLELETRNESQGIEPVLHLWDLAAHAEVAREAGRALRVHYRNAGAGERSYLVVLHAGRTGAAGQVDLYRDGRVLIPRAQVGGTRLAVAHGHGYVYQAAAVPAGLTQAAFYALDEDGRLLAFDEHSGPLGLPRIFGYDRVRSLIVASESGGGRLRVYVNDPEDHDGDGLGRELERALRTCDGPREPGCRTSLLAPYYRSVRNATRDTDRDGLPDGDELFGVRGAAELDLPRFGADPRHKDVFVEVDHQPRVEPPGLSEQDIAEIASLFAQGSARDLRNPDARPGVQLHLDVGFDPSEPAHRGLFGNWGGSNLVPSGKYKEARPGNFTPSRQRYFRYALLSNAGTGQATGDAFQINRNLHRVPLFAHELGHTLGLEHYGHESWGNANCKPNYYSIMNYVYQNRAEVGFSTGGTSTLNPARVLESQGLGPSAVPLLSEPPLELDRVGLGIDWNRDGLISDTPVRAGLQWATYKSCGGAEPGITTLYQGEVRAATPVLVRTGERLHALWLDEAGHLFWTHARVAGPDAHGSCPGGDSHPDRCMAWSSAVQVPGVAGMRQLAGLALDNGQLALAYIGDDDRVRLATLDPDEHSPGVLSDVAIPGARSRHAPALAWMDVDEARYGTNRVLGVYFRAVDKTGGALMQASALGPLGPFHTEVVRDARAQPIITALSPTLATLGTGELCGVFPDPASYVRFYCYDRSHDLWVNLSERAFYAGLGPRTLGKVGLAYHRYRAADGAPVDGDPTRGALYLSFTEPDTETARFKDNPHLFISEWLNARHGALAEINFRWRGSVINQWTHLAPGTGVTLYEDESLSALKAVMVNGTDRADVSRIDFLPLADGAYDQELGTGNDFQVMERGICARLRGPDVCGDKSTGAY